jgi:hypothetical protein
MAKLMAEVTAEIAAKVMTNATVEVMPKATA